MEKSAINEHDLTKKMLGTIRKNNIIKEAETDVITPSEDSSVFKDEAKKIADAVDPRVQITKFKIYPRDRDVQFEGRLDFGLNFFMSTKAGEVSISITDESGNSKQIYLKKDVMDAINKLNSFYQNWFRDWAEKLNTEYKPK